MLKGDCVFFAFDGTFRALLPGAAYDKLRSIPQMHGEIFTAQYTALHHQAAVHALGLRGLVCVKESSWQAIADLGLIILVITDPVKLEGCFISTTSILTPTDISSKLGGNFRFTKHNMISITHFEPLRVQAGDIVHVCEQPSGKLVKTSFPSLRLEYFERTAHCRASILQPTPDEDDHDPIIDASELGALRVYDSYAQPCWSWMVIFLITLQVSSRLRSGLLGLLDGSSPGLFPRDNSTFLCYAPSWGGVEQRLLLLTLDFFLNFESSSSWRRWAVFVLDLCYIVGVNSQRPCSASRCMRLWSLSKWSLCTLVQGIFVGGLGISMCFHELMKESWNVHVPAVHRSYAPPSCRGSRPWGIFCAATRLHVSIELHFTGRLMPYTFDSTKG